MCIVKNMFTFQKFASVVVVMSEWVLYRSARRDPDRV
jgi:hypothetical protein